MDYFLENIQKQAYKKDKRLPSEYKLARRFELTRIEVRKAYNHLRGVGHVYSRRGKGNYYAGYPEEVEFILFSTDSSSMKMSPLAGRLSMRLLNYERIVWHKDIRERLTVVQGGPVLYVKQLKYLDRVPAAMYISCVREKSFPNIREYLRRNPNLYAYFQGKGTRDIVTENTQLIISILDTEEHLHVKVGGTVPCLVLKGINRDRRTEEILELSTIIYRGGKFIFRL